MTLPMQRLSRAALWLMVLCVSCCAHASPGDHAVDLPTYIGDLQRWSQALAQIPNHPNGAAELRRSIPASIEVQYSGEHFTVSNAWLSEGLIRLERDSAQRADLEQDLEARLRMQIAQAEALSSGAEPKSLAVARMQLRAVLDRREFRFVQAPNWWDLLRARIARRIMRWMEKLLGRVHIGHRASNVISWVILCAAFLVLAFPLVKNLRRATRGMTRLELEAHGTGVQTWRDWAQAAADAFREERARDAVHNAYWAAVFRLEQMGVWRSDAARTPREYMRLLSRDSQYHTIMSNLTRNFEMAWYGFRPVTRDEARSALHQLESLGCNLQSTAATASY